MGISVTSFLQFRPIMFNVTVDYITVTEYGALASRVLHLSIIKCLKTYLSRFNLKQITFLQVCKYSFAHGVRHILVYMHLI